jgi:radical SAM protein with 4Fe4S-binding SPASM domain
MIKQQQTHAIPMKPFERTYVEITNGCNLACAFCPGTARRVEFMSTGMFEGVLAALGGYSTHLYFHVLGEPLLHPALPEFLDIAHKHGKLVNLTTNGLLIGKAGAAIAGKPALRQVTFSLHSFVPGEGVGSAEAYLNPILDFARTAAARHLISLRLLDGGEPRGRESMLAIIADAFCLPPALRKDLGGSAAVGLDKNIFLNPGRRFWWPDLNGPDFGNAGFCLALREQIAVLVDGTVVPCCLDSNGIMALGNICSQNIKEIIASDRVRRIYGGFSRRTVVEPLCRHCSYRLRFGRRAGTPLVDEA